MIAQQIKIDSKMVEGISTDIIMECVNTNIYYENEKSFIESFNITIGNVDYRTEMLSEKGNKGANSIILKMHTSEDDSDKAQRVIKILKRYDNWTPSNGISIRRCNSTFYREIECLQKCKAIGVENIIDIYDKGYLICKRKTNNGDALMYFPFYTMDCADCDLKQFLENNVLDNQTKIALCKQIASGLYELHKINCYHRDIKPDNILLFDRELKIGDLGLIRYRNDDSEDAKGIIGPKGWISPEAMNKYLNEEKKFDDRINTDINEQSDIFQLGMVFWYIFQGNAPIGCIKRDDFFDKNDQIFSLIKRMIYHSTERRIANIEEITEELSCIYDKM